MRKLHLVGLTTDRDGLIFTARKGSKSGGFIVPLDDKVLAAVAEASARDNGAPPDAGAAAPAGEAVPKRLRSESALTPREMQARLRGGRSIEEVAAEAGVDNEWVARFAVPILAEQAQVVELARGLIYAKPRLGDSSHPLGASVLQNLADRGVFLPDDVANAAWSAFQIHDSVWMVRFRYRSRGRDQEAQWEVDVPTGRLRARNRQASVLGYVDPDRWREALVDAEETLAEEDDIPGAPRRAARKRPDAEPMAKAVATAKRRTAAAPPVAPNPAKATKAAKVTKASAAGRTAKAAKVAKAPAAAKGSPRTASGKTPARRRPTKAVPAPEAGPTAGSGGVRLAVARVSTARVAASMAAADREPWAAAVRRPSRARARVDDGGGAPATDARRPAPRPGATEPAPDRGFQPRPLPAAGREPRPPRVRKVTIPRPTFNQDGTPAVSLPASRRPGPSQEPMPAERGKLRRLRSR